MGGARIMSIKMTEAESLKHKEVSPNCKSDMVLFVNQEHGWQCATCGKSVGQYASTKTTYGVVEDVGVPVSDEIR